MPPSRKDRKNPNPRAIAVELLLARFERPLTLQSAYRRNPFLKLSLRDQSLTRELVSGVLRNRALLDHLISLVSTRTLERTDRVVLCILRVSLYQLVFLRTAEYAVVSEAVDLCRLLSRSFASGFVNAVLRQFLRTRPSAPAGPSAQALAVRYSHPLWLVERFLRRYGPDLTESILERNNHHPESVVWVNPFLTTVSAFCGRLNEKGIEYELITGMPHSIWIKSRGFVRDPLYKDGHCFFMNLSSQKVAYFPDLSSYRLLGDFCAAPGGKNFILTSRMETGAKLITADLDPRRLREMKTRAENLRIPTSSCLLIDCANSVPFRSCFDFILLDVPCSGIGTVRSNPDIRWVTSENDLKRHQVRQLRMVRNAFRALVRGGSLLYATCSTEPEENEEVIEQLLVCESEARVLKPFLKTYPDNQLGDGLFAALVRRV